MFYIVDGGAHPVVTTSLKASEYTVVGASAVRPRRPCECNSAVRIATSKLSGYSLVSEVAQAC
jgi:hypothetical protein